MGLCVRFEIKQRGYEANRRSRNFSHYVVCAERSRCFAFRHRDPQLVALRRDCIAIEVSGDFRYKTDRLHNPERVYFDILNARPRIDAKRVWTRDISDRLARCVAETSPGTTRIVIDLLARSRSPPRSFPIPTA